MTNNIKFDSLDSLNDSKYEWRIKVRVIRIWDSYSARGEKEFKGRNMLLLDDKHTQMHAFIWPNYMDEFKETFEEGKIYSIRNFSVKNYRKDSLRCTRSDKQIWLSNYSKVFRIESKTQTDKMIRNVEFDFFDIADIKELIKQPDSNHLIDVIGVLKDRDVLRHFINQKEVEQCQFRFTLTDGSASIKICFWDELAESFVAELDKVMESPIIVIVASCKHNEYKGEAYVSNVGATRFFINYNHRAVDVMKNRAVLPDFYKNPVRETERNRIWSIAELRTMDPGYIMKKVMCQVLVKTVKETKDWNYEACSSCQEELEMLDGKYRCEKCKRTIPFPDQSFRLCLLGEDKSGGAAFILFNREVESVLGMTVYDILTNDKMFEKNVDFPSVLKTFEGNQYTMMIRLTDDNVNKGSNTYFVEDIYKGFQIVENDSPDDDDLNVGFNNSQHSSAISVSNNTLKTPDTEKSTSTNKLKRINEKSVVSITNLEDETDGDGHECLPKKKTPIKQIKKEKV